MGAEVSIHLTTSQWRLEKYEILLANGEILVIGAKRNFRLPFKNIYYLSVNSNSNYSSTRDKYLKVCRSLVKFFLTHPLFSLKMFLNSKILNFRVENKALIDYIVVRNFQNKLPLWVSREAVKSNILIYDLASSLEVELTSQQSRFGGFVWNLRIRNEGVLSLPLLETAEYEVQDPKTLNESKILFSNTDMESGFGSLEIDNCQVVHGRYVVKGQNIFRQSDSNFMNEKYYPADINHHQDDSKISTLVTKIHTRSLDSAIFVGSHRNLFHFLYENLTRLSYLMSIQDYPKTIIISDAVPEQLLQFLKIIFPYEIIQSGYYERIEVGKLLLGFDFGFQGKMTIAGRENSLLGLRQKILQEIPHSKVRNSRIFLERPRGATRPIQNKKKLLELLDELGFVRILPENLTFIEQVQLFQSSKLIVGEEGAALTNLLFIKEQTTIIELQEQNMLSKMLFHDLSSLCLSKHHIVFGKSCYFGNSGFATDGFKISLRSLRKLIVENIRM